MKLHALRLAFAVFFLGSSLLAEAAMYMGTGSQVPPAEMPSLLAQPEIAAPYITTDALPLPMECQPFTGKGPMPPNACATELSVPIYGKPIVVTIREGSLKDNVERIARQAGWNEVVWKPDYDYHWLGNVTITASDVQGVMTKLLEPYPLQAVFYNANHVVAIMPRRNT